MKAGGISVDCSSGFIADSTNKAAAVHYHIHCRGDNQLNTAHKGMDVDFLILVNDGFAQIQTDSTTICFKPGTMKWFSVINVFITTKTHRAADSFAVLSERYGTLKPPVSVMPETADDETHTYK